MFEDDANVMGNNSARFKASAEVGVAAPAAQQSVQELERPWAKWPLPQPGHEPCAILGNERFWGASASLVTFSAFPFPRTWLAVQGEEKPVHLPGLHSVHGY